MKTKFFRNNNQRRTILSPEGHLSGRAATLSRVAHLSCLLVLLTATFCVSAQNGVTVSGLVVNAGTVTFNVSWETPMPVEPWSDTVWVFVDYNNEGKMERLPVTDAATSAGTVTKIPGNDSGVWVIGNARIANIFSATVTLLTSNQNVAGACVYASNYPPVGKYTTAASVSFTGTPMYKIELKETDGTGVLTEYADGLYTIRTGYTIESFTDATGAPGVFSCSTPAVQTLSASGSSYCAGSGVTLALDGTEFGVTYQLYENNEPQSGATLTGTDAAATFTGLFGAGIYSVQTVSDDHYCPVEMNGLITVTERALPDTPTATDGQRCNAGTVTIYAKAANSNIYWFESPAATYNVSGMTASNTFTTPVLSTTTSYYAAAEDTNSGCVSATGAVVTASIFASADLNEAPHPYCGCAAGLKDCTGYCLYEAGRYMKYLPEREKCIVYETEECSSLTTEVNAYWMTWGSIGWNPTAIPCEGDCRDCCCEAGGTGWEVGLYQECFCR